MREKNSERPDTRDNRSKNSTKTGKKKKNTKNQEFAVITYSFLALFICLMGYFSYFQFFKSEEFINNPYNTRQETFAQKIVRGQILTNDGQVLAETVTDSEGNETRRYPYGSIFSHIVGYSTKGKSGIESLANFNLLRSNTAFIDKVGDEMQGEKSPGDNVVTTLDYGLQATAYDALGYYKGAIVVLEPSTGKILAMVSKPDFDPRNMQTMKITVIPVQAVIRLEIIRSTAMETRAMERRICARHLPIPAMHFTHRLEWNLTSTSLDSCVIKCCLIPAFRRICRHLRAVLC